MCSVCTCGRGPGGHGGGSQLAIEGPAQRAGGTAARIWGARPWTLNQTLLPWVACPYCQECLRSAGVGGGCRMASMSPQGPAVMPSSDGNLLSVALSLPSHWGCLEGGALSSPAYYRHPKAGPRLHSKFLATWGLGLHHLYPTPRRAMRRCF